MRKKENSNYRLMNLAMAIAKAINFILDTIMKLPLILSVIVTGLLISLPVAGAWYLFALAFSLHPLLRAILIWGAFLFLVILSAAVDYLRSAK
jgi:hypothetical protein